MTAKATIKHYSLVNMIQKLTIYETYHVSMNYILFKYFLKSKVGLF